MSKLKKAHSVSPADKKNRYIFRPLKSPAFFWPKGGRSSAFISSNVGRPDIDIFFIIKQHSCNEGVGALQVITENIICY